VRKGVRFNKFLGLLLTDSCLSEYLRKNHTKLVCFRGLTLETLHALLTTLPDLVETVEISLNKQNFKRLGSCYFDLKIFLRNYVSKSLREAVKHLIVNPEKYVRNLGFSERAALLAGIIDGDGYVGKPGGYIAISFNMSSEKGRVIYRILHSLKELGYITTGKYRSKPHYEQQIRFVNLTFLEETMKFIFHKKRRIRLLRYYENLKQIYECKYSVKELKDLLAKAYSAYVDFRYSERRTAPILVIYLRNEEGNRVMKKISQKCKKKLEALLYNIEKLKVEDNVAKALRKFLEHNKSL